MARYRKLPPVKICQIDPFSRYPAPLRREARDILNALRSHTGQPLAVYADQYPALALALRAAKTQGLRAPRPYFLAGPRPSPPA
jgi:hypothetical protein